MEIRPPSLGVIPQYTHDKLDVCLIACVGDTAAFDHKLIPHTGTYWLAHRWLQFFGCYGPGMYPNWSEKKGFISDN